MKKLIYSLINLISIFILPWYVPVVISIIGLFVFDHFIFILFIGFILDIFYGHIGDFSFIFSLTSFLIYIFSLFLKDRIRIN
jgi:hypothetical protein